jgi:hypothetical protein
MRPAARGVSVHLHPAGGLQVHRLYRCLAVLASTGTPMTPAEIAVRAGGASNGSRYSGRPITGNNVNKILKAARGLATRTQRSRYETSYQITNIGRSYLRAIDELTEARKQAAAQNPG